MSKQLNQKQSRFIQRFNELFPNNYYSDDLLLILRNGLYSVNEASMLNKLACIYRVMKDTIPNLENITGGIFREEHEYSQDPSGFRTYTEIHISVVLPPPVGFVSRVRYEYTCKPIDDKNYVVTHNTIDFGNF